MPSKASGFQSQGFSFCLRLSLACGEGVFRSQAADFVWNPIGQFILETSVRADSYIPYQKPIYLSLKHGISKCGEQIPQILSNTLPYRERAPEFISKICGEIKCGADREVQRRAASAATMIAIVLLAMRRLKVTFLEGGSHDLRNAQ